MYKKKRFKQCKTKHNRIAIWFTKFSSHAGFCSKNHRSCVQLSSPLTWRYCKRYCVSIALRMRQITKIGGVQLQKAVSFLLTFKIVGKSDRTAKGVGNLQIYLPTISTRQN